MRNYLKISYNRNVLLVLFVLIAVHVLAILSNHHVLLQVTKPLFIPFLFMCYLLKNKQTKPVMVVFLISFFLADFLSALATSPLLIGLAKICYTISFVSLITAVVTRMALRNLDKVIAICLLLLFGIGVYLLFGFISLLQVDVWQSKAFLLILGKSITVLLLAIIAFANFISKQTSRSILFLIAALCFAFADTFFYVHNFFVSHWILEVLNTVLQVVGLFFLFKVSVQYAQETKKASLLKNGQHPNKMVFKQ
ncbi:hypothetical protein ACFSQP_09920 [Bizionia sediminis]|uniref:YhhN-like protein n=1 Tax=Bizionia sediminis TaxID=1737064 RepID=A0ABW5KSZ4_9FLAO